MNMLPYVGGHQCLRYAVLVGQVASGLDLVISEGMLPPCYQGVFRIAIDFCDDIISGAYNEVHGKANPFGVRVAEILSDPS